MQRLFGHTKIAVRQIVHSDPKSHNKTFEKHGVKGGIQTSKGLLEKGLIKKIATPVKVLGDGELKRKLTVEAHKFSKSAVEKINKTGGSVKPLSPQGRPDA